MQNEDSFFGSLGAMLGAVIRAIVAGIFWLVLAMLLLGGLIG